MASNSFVDHRKVRKVLWKKKGFDTHFRLVKTYQGWHYLQIWQGKSWEYMDKYLPDDSTELRLFGRDFAALEEAL